MSDSGFRIVVLDGKPLNNGDLDWSPLASLGDLQLHDNTAAEQVGERIANANAVFTNKVPVRETAIEAASDLKFIGVLATGFDNVDVAAARSRGIIVSNVPSYSAGFTAQSTFALLLELTHHIGHHAGRVREGEWERAGYFSFWDHPLVELEGKTLLIVGLGRIGSRVAAIATAMGMKVVAAHLPGRDGGSTSPYPRLPMEDALPRADVISLHCPLTPQTRGLINEAALALMKPTALLVNNARGLLVDEAALATALRENRIAGYAGDVLSKEPPLPDNPLLHSPRCIITPHLSWASIECRSRLLNTSIENLRCFLVGRPQNVVS